MIYCHQCGKQLPEHTRFCTACGTALQPPTAVQSEVSDDTHIRPMFAPIADPAPAAEEPTASDEVDERTVARSALTDSSPAPADEHAAVSEGVDDRTVARSALTESAPASPPAPAPASRSLRGRGPDP